MSATEYGKLVRKLRIDAGRSARNMADSLGVTPAYLSALETGKRNVPAPFIKMVASYFEVSGICDANLFDKIDRAAFNSRNVFEIKPRKEDRDLVSMFVRKLPHMRDAEKEKIMQVLAESTHDLPKAG